METLTKTKLVLMLKDAIRYPENATHENEWLEAWQIFTQHQGARRNYYER